MVSIAASVRNVQVFRTDPSSDTSVIVLWDRIDSVVFDGYIVYYSSVLDGVTQEEVSVTVPSSKNYVTFTGLTSGAEYQFQVAVTATIQGQQLIGERSDVNADTRIDIQLTTLPNCGGMVCTAIVVCYNMSL